MSPRSGILGALAEPEDLEIAIGDPGDRAGRDRRAPLVELGDEPLEDVAELLVLRERKAALADELGVTAAVSIRRRQAAGERLEERVRAGVVAARGDVEVLRSEERGERVRVERADDANVLEAAPERAPRRSARSARGRGSGRATRAPRRPSADCPTSSSR